MWILLLMILIMPFEMNPYLKISHNFFGLPEFTVIKLLGLVGLVWSLGQWLTGSVRPRLIESGQSRAFFIYVFAVIFAGMLNGAGRTSGTRMLSIALLMPLILTAVQRPRDLVRALQTAGIILILVFPYALRNMIRFGGRLGVGLYEPNYLALSLVLLFPLAFVFALHEPPGTRRWLYWGGLGVMLISLALTGSRGGFLGAFVVFVLLGVRVVRRPALTIAVMAGLILGLFVVPSPLQRRIMATISSDAHSTAVSGSTEGRIEIAKAGLRMIARNPLTGVGLGNFKAKSIEYGAEDDKIAHNTWIEVGAELGLPALLTFLLVLAATFRSLGRSRRLGEQAGFPFMRDLATSIQVGLTGYCVSGTFLSAEYEKFFWLVVFLSICMERLLRPAAARNGALQATAQPAWAR